MADQRGEVLTMTTPTLTILPAPDSGHGAMEVSPVWMNGGLAVYETPRLRAAPRILWSVGHVSSGMALIRAARSEAQAIQLAERLLQVTDWERSAAELITTPGLGAQVKAALGEPLA